MNELNKGTVKLDNENYGKVTNLYFTVNENIQEVNIKTSKKYEIEICVKLPLIDRIRKFFGMKTRFEKMMIEGMAK